MKRRRTFGRRTIQKYRLDLAAAAALRAADPVGALATSLRTLCPGMPPEVVEPAARGALRRMNGEARHGFLAVVGALIHGGQSE